MVTLGPDVSGQSAAAPIAAFLAQYFAAINDHDFQAYISLFTQAAETETAQGFSSGYASTRDSREMLVALSPAQHGKTAASVTFASHQSLSTSHSGSTCTDWRIILYLRPVGSSYLIGKGPASYRASFRACS